MKKCLFSLIVALQFLPCLAQERTFVGSTPAHDIIREFLQLSLTDSIDFIRWKLDIRPGKFKLQCSYGLAKPGTPGFSNEQRVAFEGQLRKKTNYYYLQHNGRNASLLEVNANVLHFLDRYNMMLPGNGGYSYALNNTSPVEADAVNIAFDHTVIKGSPLVYEGRTPCSDLPELLGLKKTEACNKMKWYFLLYTDSLNGKPSYFLMGGMGYRKETMAKGSWQMVKEKGRIVYQLYSDKWTHPLHLLKGDDNILFFIDAKGRLLVGNEDFSYTLNRRKEAYPRRDR